jgi:hypothetical protein
MRALGRREGGVRQGERRTGSRAKGETARRNKRGIVLPAKILVPHLRAARLSRAAPTASRLLRALAREESLSPRVGRREGRGRQGGGGGGGGEAEPGLVHFCARWCQAAMFHLGARHTLAPRCLASGSYILPPYPTRRVSIYSPRPLVPQPTSPRPTNRPPTPPRPKCNPTRSPRSVTPSVPVSLLMSMGPGLPDTFSSLGPRDLDFRIDDYTQDLRPFPTSSSLPLATLFPPPPFLILPRTQRQFTLICTSSWPSGD